MEGIASRCGGDGIPGLGRLNRLGVWRSHVSEAKLLDGKVFSGLVRDESLF